MPADAVAIICSRTNSSRIPSKPFFKIAGTESIKHLLARIASLDFPKILAVPASEFTSYLHLEKEYKVQVMPGDAFSPLHRMAEVATAFAKIPKWIVRITHDDILQDPESIVGLLQLCEKEDSGYGVMPDIIRGADAEVIRTVNLLKAAELIKQPTEFVSYFVHGEKMPYPKTSRFFARPSVSRPHSLSLDYPEDATALEVVLRNSPAESLDKIVEKLDDKPWLMDFNKKPEISFYTCAYNAEDTIEETIRSVLWNPSKDIEYIIVDDCSTDGTLEKIAQYAYDKRIKVRVNQTNLSLASSSNIAVGLAKADKVMRVDADDVLITHDLSHHMSEMSKLLDYGAGVVYPAYTQIGIDDPEKWIGGAVNHHAGCALMSKRMLNEIRFKEGLRDWDSLELYKRFKAMAPGAVKYYNNPTWKYRIRSNSMSRTNLEEREKVKPI